MAPTTSASGAPSLFAAADWPASVWDWFAAVVSPAWVADWYQTHAQRGGGGLFSPALTLWLLLAQKLGGLSNEAAWLRLTPAQARALSPRSARARRATLSASPSGYDYARRHVPLAFLEAAFELVHDDLETRLAPRAAARRAYALDGSSVRLAAGPAVRARYPPASNQHGASHWGVVRWVTAHALDTGLAVRPAWGPMFGPAAVSEQALAEAVLARLPRGAVVLADANFGTFQVAWRMAELGLAPVVRLTASRARRLLGPARLLQPGAHGVSWRPSPGDRRAHPHLPAEARLDGRVVAFAVDTDRGPRLAWVWTTEPGWSAATVAAWAAQRWEVEGDLRTLKQAVGLETLGVRSAGMADKDLLMGVAAYNVLRWVMGEAAATRGLAPRRMSFTRARHAVAAWAPRLQAAPGEARGAAWQALLRTIAARPLPLRERPRQPRQVWPTGKRYPLRKAAPPGPAPTPEAATPETG